MGDFLGINSCLEVSNWMSCEFFTQQTCQMYLILYTRLPPIRLMYHHSHPIFFVITYCHFISATLPCIRLQLYWYVRDVREFVYTYFLTSFCFPSFAELLRAQLDSIYPPAHRIVFHVIFRCYDVIYSFFVSSQCSLQFVPDDDIKTMHADINAACPCHVQMRSR